MEENNGTTIIVMSGDFDKVFAAFQYCPVGAASMGERDQHVFHFRI